jgi:ABC-type Mn2+/Zn2+ transport system permease subunit
MTAIVIIWGELWVLIVIVVIFKDFIFAYFNPLSRNFFGHNVQTHGNTSHEIRGQDSNRFSRG